MIKKAALSLVFVSMSLFAGQQTSSVSFVDVKNAVGKTILKQQNIIALQMLQNEKTKELEKKVANLEKRISDITEVRLSDKNNIVLGTVVPKWLHFRTKPSGEAKIAGAYKHGTEIILLKCMNDWGGWCKTNNGYYVNSKYLKFGNINRHSGILSDSL